MPLGQPFHHGPNTLSQLHQSGVLARFWNRGLFRNILVGPLPAKIVDNCIPCDLIEPALNSSIIFQSADSLMNLNEDLLKKVVYAGRVCDPPGNEAVIAFVGFAHVEQLDLVRREPAFELLHRHRRDALAAACFPPADEVEDPDGVQAACRAPCLALVRGVDYDLPVREDERGLRRE